MSPLKEIDESHVDNKGSRGTDLTTDYFSFSADCMANLYSSQSCSNFFPVALLSLSTGNGPIPVELLLF